MGFVGLMTRSFFAPVGGRFSPANRSIRCRIAAHGRTWAVLWRLSAALLIHHKILV
jgi:hypothetical protein